MKLAKIFLLIVVAVSSLSEAKSRQKRTLGTILNFFGYKLVPLHGGGSKEALADIAAEKYVYQPETPRNPKFMRIQTVMPPFRVVEVTSKPTFEFDVRQEATTEEPPMTSERMMMMMENTPAALEDARPSEDTTTEQQMAPTEATMRPAMMPLETSSPSEPLKIILEDMPTTSEQPAPETSTETEQMTTTEATVVESQTENSLNQQEFPTRFNSNDQPMNGNSFVQQSQFQPNDVNSLSHDHQFHQFPPQFPSYNQPNPNFEIFKSQDLSDSFLGQPNHFGSFQPQFVQQAQFFAPRPFTNFNDQSAHPSNGYSYYTPNQGSNHFSTSRTAMNMNGQAYDYMTHH